MTASPRKAPATSAAPAADQSARTVTVAVNGEIHNYPDMSERFAEFRAAGGVLLSRWLADRLASDVLSRTRWLDRVPAWCYLDDYAVAYLVDYTRKSARARVARATIVGAARYGEDPVEVVRIQGPEASLLAEPPADGVSDEDQS